MRLPHVSPNVTLDITEDYGRGHATTVVARTQFDGEIFCQAFRVLGGAPEEYARSKLDQMALEIGRRVIFGKQGRADAGGVREVTREGVALATTQGNYY